MFCAGSGLSLMQGLDPETTPTTTGLRQERRVSWGQTRLSAPGLWSSTSSSDDNLLPLLSSLSRGTMAWMPRSFQDRGKETSVNRRVNIL